MFDQITIDSKPAIIRKARLRYDQVRKTNLLLLPERVVKLSPTAAAILRLCDGSVTVGEIVIELEARYARAGLKEEVMEFLQQAAAQGWIE